MKVPSCGNDGCQNRSLSRFVSVPIVAAGASLLTLLTVESRLGDGALQRFRESFEIEVNMALIATVLSVLLVIGISFLERFESWIVAFVFGASTPGLLYGIASLGAFR